MLREILNDFMKSTHIEWLMVNKNGSYSLGTVSGSTARVYSALLTIMHENRRISVLNRIEDYLIIENRRYDLSSQLYPGGVIHPTGFNNIVEFELNPYPKWIFTAGGVTIERRYVLHPDEDTFIVEYKIIHSPYESSKLKIELRPLITFKSHHEILLQSKANYTTKYEEKYAIIESAGYPRLYCITDGSFIKESFWYKNLEHIIERERGGSLYEDMFSPFGIELKFKNGVAKVLFSMKPYEAVYSGFKQENFKESAYKKYYIDTEKLKGIIAGYPWYGVWVRNTLMAIPGILLVNEKYEEAKKILLKFIGDFSNGVIPLLYDEQTQAPNYNSVDTSLWLYWCLQKYIEYTKDENFIKEITQVLLDIFNSYKNGKNNLGIKMDEDGLLNIDSNIPLTWMNTTTSHGAVNLRSGKPVEIEALWYNALLFLKELEIKNIMHNVDVEAITKNARKSFNEKFYNEEKQYLFDEIKSRDARIRPNALYTIALPYEILEQEKFATIVNTATKELLTPYGLRTLSPKEKGYKPRCTGTPEEIANSFHNGSVFPHLIGIFINSFLKAYGRSEENIKKAEEFIKPLIKNTFSGINEVFDGDAPHLPRGCPFYSLAAAEIIRVIHEEGLNIII